MPSVRNEEDIQQRTLRVLEWDRLKQFVANEADSNGGKELCLNLELADHRVVIEQLLDETREALAMYQARSGISAADLPDLEEVLERLKIGASLSSAELLAVRNTLVIGRKFRSNLSQLETEHFPRLTAYLPELPQAEKLIQEIDNAIDEGGNVKDKASSLLRSLRQEVLKFDSMIKETLQRIIHSATQAKALTDPLYTQRNGRFVLPVNASMRSSVSGIVHDSSASGLTVYVEPIAVLELSNQQRMKQAEIEREIARILEVLTRFAVSHLEAIASTYSTCMHLDAIMARAKIAFKYKGERPELSRDERFNFLTARHPLLMLQDEQSTVVPNDIVLGGNSGSTLIITGPNTGGKTVLLKTIGIFSLMIRAGLLLPVSPGSTAAIFTRVCADIGDEQSLEQSLSTFSSHMKNIVEIVEQCAAGSLVLLDELGAGTDPREGAALARAVLEYLNHSGAVTISTTHFGELKTLAYTEPSFINGSLDFDEQTLSPTYKLRLGVPGSSKATTIAKRLGLNIDVINRAEALVEVHDQDLQRTVELLEIKLREATVREEQAQQAKQQAEELKQFTEEQMRKLEVDTRALRQKQINDIESEFKLGKDYIKHLIADLQKQPSMSKAQKAQQEMEKVRNELGWKSIEEDRTPTLVVGQNVKVLSLNQIGIVTEITTETAKEPAQVTVKCGNLRIKVPKSDLEMLGKEKQKQIQQNKQKLTVKVEAPTHRTKGSTIDVFVRTAANTLDLRGKRVDDGMADLVQFLDDNLLTNTSPLMIIHGHGTGAMKNAVRDYLHKQMPKGSYRSGDIHEGGDGVTMVTL
ncbi:MAG TPA: endonuclease MutS2 [Drouetiella sp.]|jgi:DNA mismatch repair protein MutS2